MSLLSVPLKTVLMYHADLQNETLPESYAACDGTLLSSANQDINPGGTYQLPDLRNRFILGADITKAATTTGGTTNSSGDAPGPKGAGGVHSKSLVVGELPIFTVSGSVDAGGVHVHTGSTNSSGAHVHSGSTTSTTGAHSHSISDPGHSHSQHMILGGAGANTPTNGGNGGDGLVTTGTSGTGISINSNGDHSHSLTIVSDGSHTHTLTIDPGSGSHTHTFTSNSIGGNTAFDTRPRYYGLIFIMKVKK